MYTEVQSTSDAHLEGQGTRVGHLGVRSVMEQLQNRVENDTLTSIALVRTIVGDGRGGNWWTVAGGCIGEVTYIQ